MSVSRKLSPLPIKGFTRPQFLTVQSNHLKKHQRIERQFYCITRTDKIRSSRRNLVCSSRLSSYSAKDGEGQSIHERSALDSLIQEYEKENKPLSFPGVRKQRGLSEACVAEQQEALMDYYNYQPKISRMNWPRLISKQIHFKCQANRMRDYLCPEYKYN